MFAPFVDDLDARLAGNTAISRQTLLSASHARLERNLPTIFYASDTVRSTHDRFLTNLIPPARGRANARPRLPFAGNSHTAS